MRLHGGAMLVAAMMATAAQADPVADFYRGNTIRIINWASAGGEYDIHGKLVSRFLGRHLPGQPTVLHQTMTGGGGLVAANYLYNVAPKDGTTLGIMVSSLPLSQVLGDSAVRFDAGRFHWIGTIAPTQECLVAWHTTGITTWNEMTKREFVLGASGAGSPSVMVPTVMNALLGTRIKIVPGYPGGAQINLAMERGESMGRWNTLSSWKVTNPNWIANKNIVFLVQSALKTSHGVTDAPLLTDLARNDDDRKIFALLATGSELGRPLVGSPGIPPERLAALINAYRALFKDEDFRHEAQNLKIEIDPIIGQDLQAIVTSALATPKPLAERLKKLVE
ncbi:MAG TPA: hypothetical protein VGU72_11990 [Beijerinckiaceae bacterium]|nr:hypothetical protein [Beijerinckiaceae bacterium]